MKLYPISLYGSCTQPWRCHPSCLKAKALNRINLGKGQLHLILKNSKSQSQASLNLENVKNFDPVNPWPQKLETASLEKS